MKTNESIDAYIGEFPDETQAGLQELRAKIHETIPEATEKISYAMPTFYLYGNVIHFAAWEKHIGLYPGAEAVVVFADQLADYETTKGTIKFPLDKPLPYDLIEEIVVYLAARNTANYEAKQAKKKKK